MFAIIKTGGNQYKVQIDNRIFVEKLENAPGDTIELSDVLMVGKDADITVGSPLVKGAHVVALVENQIRDPKVIVFKKKRRQNYRRKKGHRQYKTVLRILEIVVGGKSVAATTGPRTVAPVVAKTAAAKAPAPKKVVAAPKKAAPAPKAAAAPKAEAAPKKAAAPKAKAAVAPKAAAKPKKPAATKDKA